MLESLLKQIEETGAYTLGDAVWLDNHRCKIYLRMVALDPMGCDLTPFFYQCSVFNELYLITVPGLNDYYPSLLVHHIRNILELTGRRAVKDPKEIHEDFQSYVEQRLLLLERLLDHLDNLCQTSGTSDSTNPQVTPV